MTALRVLSRHVMAQLELRRVVGELQKTQEEFQAFSRNVDGILYTVESDDEDPLAARVNFINDRVEPVLGYTTEELSGGPQNWAAILHPDDVEIVAEATRRLHAEGREVTRTYRVKHKRTGEYVWLEDRAVPRFDGNGKVVGAKKFTEMAYMAHVPSLDSGEREKALKVAADLEKAKTFEIARDEVASIDVKAPGKLKPGSLVFKTTAGEHKLTVMGSAGTGLKDVLEFVQRVLGNFAPGRIQKVG